MVNWPRVPWFGPQENDGGSRSRLRDFPGPVRVSSRPGDDFWDAEPEETPAPNPPAKTAGGDQSTAAPDQNPSPEFQYDQALAAEAPKRWCPEIDPNSADFAAILEDFGSMLADPSLTICDILEGTFAPHERALLLPTDRRQNPALYAIQKENRARYAELLDSERFGDEWKKTADLAFKLTLAYFGLPVAPLRADFSQQFPRFGDESDVEGEVLEAGDDDAPEGGRLRFLNCYKFRSYEHDVLRDPDSILEQYYAFQDLRKVGPARRIPERTKGHSAPTSLALRGGGSSDSDSDSDTSMLDAGVEYDSDTADSEKEPEASGQVSIRGGGHLRQLGHVYRKFQANSTELSNIAAFASSNGHLDLLQSPLGGEKLSHDDFWLPLYGYQGIVWFRLGYLNTFVDAIDRLLCLDNRAGVSYSLYLLDRNKNYTSEEEQSQFLADDDAGVTVWAKGPGDFSHDAFAHAWVLSKLDGLGRNVAADGPKALHDQVLFLAGPDDPIPWEWEPGPRHQRVVKFVLEWEKAPSLNRPDVAYVRLPESSAASYSNHYAPWMAQACRVLAAGRIPGRPGRPAIPDAFFALKPADDGKTNSGPGSYGGLGFLPTLWSDISDRYNINGLETRVLVAKTPHNKASDRFHIFLPGYSRPYDAQSQSILHSELGKKNVAKKRILNLLEDSMSPSNFNDKLKAVEVHLPGDGFFTISDDESSHGLVVSRESLLQDGEIDELVERLIQWKEWLGNKDGVLPFESGLGMFPQFITLRPVFKAYLIHDGTGEGSDGASHESTSWQPDANDSLATFRQKVYRLWHGDEIGLPKDSWISITQLSPEAASPTGTYKHTDTSKPNFLIGPMTSDAEWREIVKMIISPDIIVHMADERSAPVFGEDDTEQPFGYRDIYETNHTILYGQRLGDVPHPIQLRYEDFQTRYNDFQVYQQDSIPGLKTLQPGQKQPAAPTLARGKNQFKLIIPRHAAAAAAPASPAQARRSQWRRPTPVFEPRPVTDAQRAMRMREHSYAHPLSVQGERSIPIHAPPLETLISTGHDSLPVVSTAVLTPTEVRRLQKDYFEMRSLLLKRSQKCPYDGCQAIYPYNRPEAMQQHLRDVHVGDRCNFCNEILYKHWPPEERYNHLIKKHQNLLSSLQTHERDFTAQVPAESAEPPAEPDPREAEWNYCSRCGRDHTVLDSRADRAQHDKICFPSITERRSGGRFCETCGGVVDGEASSHKHEDHAAEGSFCQNCALSLVLFSNAYRVKHQSFCKKGGREEFKHCPWCGLPLSPDLKKGKAHIRSCRDKPSPDALGPTDPYEEFRKTNEVSRADLEEYVPEGGVFNVSDDTPSVAPLAAGKGSEAAKGLHTPKRQPPTPGTSGRKTKSARLASDSKTSNKGVGVEPIFGLAKESSDQTPAVSAHGQGRGEASRKPNTAGPPQAVVDRSRKEKDRDDPFYIDSPGPENDPFYIDIPRTTKKVSLAKNAAVAAPSKRKLKETASGASPPKKARAAPDKAVLEKIGMVTRSRRK